MICVELCYLYLVLSSGARKGTLVTFSPSNCPVLLYWPAATPSVTIIQHWAPKLGASWGTLLPWHLIHSSLLHWSQKISEYFQYCSAWSLPALWAAGGTPAEGTKGARVGRVEERTVTPAAAHGNRVRGSSLGRQILLCSELENRTTFCQAISVG